MTSFSPGDASRSAFLDVSSNNGTCRRATHRVCSVQRGLTGNGPISYRPKGLYNDSEWNQVSLKHSNSFNVAFNVAHLVKQHRASYLLYLVSGTLTPGVLLGTSVTFKNMLRVKINNKWHMFYWCLHIFLAGPRLKPSCSCAVQYCAEGFYIER